MLKVSPFAIVTFALFTVAGISYDAVARPGGGGGGRSPGGPGGAGGAGGAGRVGGVGGAGGAAGFGGAAGVGQVGGAGGVGRVGGVGGAGGAAGFGGAAGVGQIGGAGGVGRVGGPAGGVNRVSPNQLNNFIGNPVEQRGAYDRNTVNRTDIRQTNVTQTNIAQTNLQNHLGTLSNKAFTPKWYAQNPNAWQWQHPHADAYAAATWSNAATWVGIGAAPVAYGYNNGAVVYQDNTYTNYDNAQQAEASTALVGAADNYNADSAEWLPLGVFGLVPGQQTNATSMVQLQVSKEGIINGSYMDLLSHASSSLQGSVDTRSQLAAWKVGDSENVVFETTLSSLTTDSAPVTVRFGSQQPQQWQLVRVKQ